MKVAIDKDTIKYIDDLSEFDFIYVFDNEPISELLNLGVHCVNKRYLKAVDINLTDYRIDCIKRAKPTDKNWKKKPEIKNNKFAVIIPNFNYRELLEKCIGSVLEQTYTNYEIIFVDDVSTDRSARTAKRLIGNKGKVIELQQKRLNGGARNEAYLHVSDDVDYLIYLDSDDWFRDKYVFEKINRKLQNDEDVLFIGICYYKNGKLVDCFEPNYKDRYEAIKEWSGSCGKVIKKSLATRQECLYNEGTLKEDRNQHCRICIYMNEFNCMSECVYVWNRENRKSVTTIRDKAIWGTSTIRHYADTLQLYLQEQGKDAKIDSYLEERVKKCKKEMEIGGDRQW